MKIISRTIKHMMLSLIWSVSCFCFAINTLVMAEIKDNDLTNLSISSDDVTKVQEVNLFKKSTLNTLIDENINQFWSDIHWKMPVPKQWKTVYAEDIGFSADGSDQSKRLNAYIRDGMQAYTKLIFPAGRYVFNTTINIKNSNFIIEGQGAGQTIFDFKNTNGHAFRLFRPVTQKTLITKEVVVGGREVFVADIAGFKEGDLISVFEDIENFEPWGRQSRGGVFLINKIDASQKMIEINLPLHIGLDDVFKKNAQVINITKYKNIGFQNFTIERANTSGSNFYFTGVYNLFVKGVHSINTPKHHFHISQSHHVVISDCYLENAFNQGVGGNGYGFIIEKLSTNILVTNNIIKDVRHEVGFQMGANNNIYSYNYHVDTFQDNCLENPTNAICSQRSATLHQKNIYYEADIVLHGHMAHHNLFEGNVGHWFVNDYVHFENGPFNTFFRNKIKGQPAGISWLPKVGLYVYGPQQQTIVIGNCFMNNSYVKEDEKVLNSFYAGNLYQGVQRYSESKKYKVQLEDHFNGVVETYYPSLYLKNKLPDFWLKNMPFPAFGSDICFSKTNKIPAQLHFQNIKKNH